MLFWLKAKRQLESHRLDDLLAAEHTIVKQVILASTASRKFNETATKTASATIEVRQKARSALIPQSEIEDFQKHELTLKSAAMQVSELTKEIDAARNIADLTGIAADLRLAILANCNARLNDEANAIERRLRSIQIAQESLATYQNVIEQRFGTQSRGILAGVELLMRDVLPSIDVAYEKTATLRSNLRELDKPIEGAAGKLLGLFTQKSTSSKVSALSLMKEIDPAASGAITVIQALSDGIANVKKETTALMAVVRPLNTAFFEFSKQRSRANIAGIVAAAKSGSPYFDSKTGVFDPTIKKIDEARPHINRLRTMSSSMKLALARNFVEKCADSADSLVSTVQKPFLSGRDELPPKIRTTG